MTDLTWIDAALVAARPRAVGALLRYFRDLDLAEEAFQDACLKALQTWPVKGPPRDPAAWLIFVGRNVGVDGVRRRGKQTELFTIAGSKLERETIPLDKGEPVVGVVADREGRVVVATRDGTIATRIKGAWTSTDVRVEIPAAKPGPAPATSETAAPATSETAAP